jgi:RNA polymerase sigma factor for flagellar operon FliA
MSSVGLMHKEGNDTPEKLFKLYRRTRDPEIKKKLMILYADFVRNIVRKMNLTFAGSLLGEDDLVDMGMLGLSDAIDKFDPKVGVKFETYAYTRIRGSIIDEMRKLDNLSRSVRNKIDKVDKARIKVENEVGDRAGRYLIADEAGLSIEEYDHIATIEQTSKRVSFNLDIGDNIELGDLIKSDGKNPEEDLLENEIKQAIADELKKLSENERLIIVLYYYEELTFKDIAEILKLSESRVSQLHAGALRKIRESLKSKFSF